MKKEYCHKLTARYRAALEGCVLSALAAWCFAAALLKILTVGIFGGFTALAPFAAGDFRLFALLFALGLLLCLIARNLAERRGKTPPATALTRLLCGCFGGYCALTLPACPDPFYWLALCGLWALLLAFVWLSDELAPSSTVSDRVGKLISRITEKLRVGEHSMATGQSS